MARIEMNKCTHWPTKAGPSNKIRTLQCYLQGRERCSPRLRAAAQKKRGETERSYREMWNLSFRDKVAKLMKCFWTFVFLHSSSNWVQKQTKAKAGDQITAQKVGEGLFVPLNLEFNTWAFCQFYQLFTIQKIHRGKIISELNRNSRKTLKERKTFIMNNWENIQYHHHFFQGCRSLQHSYTVSCFTVKQRKCTRWEVV